MVPLGGGAEPVSIEALPNRVFDILAKTQVMLSGTSGAALPLSQHGEGTQSLAVICLFDAFLDAQLIGEFGEGAVPILTLEEPEAHLHPAAVRAVGQMLSGFVGQKLISTHSGDLLSSVPLKSLRRLRRVGDDVKIYSIADNAFTEHEFQRLNHHVTRHRGGLLFAKVWIIVEGESDELAIQEAARIMGFDLFGIGICCFETNIGYAPFIKLADQLGIHWIATADGDAAGEGYINTSRAFLNGRVEADHIRQVPAFDIENYLCHSGFGQLYLQSMSAQKVQNYPLPDAIDAVSYWKQVIKNQGYLDGKPAKMLSVFEHIENLGSVALPLYLRETVELAVAKAKEGD
nr:DUF2813 domain-containing protein [Polymorphobacter multimanifer]